MSNPAKHRRILIVTRNLPPLVGGMERLNWHVAEELAKVADVHVVGPEGSAKLAPAGVAVREAPLKPLWKFLIRARALARREAREWKPDLVLAGSGLTAPLVRSAARCCDARTAVYVHGLDVAVKHPVYRAMWLPAIRHMDRVIANSRATAGLCRAAGVDPARIGIVHPGVDLPETVIPLSPPSLAKGEESAAAFGADSQVVPTPFGAQGEESAAAFGANSQVAPTPFGAQGEESAAAFGANSQVAPTPFGTQGEESAAAFGANSQVVPTPFGTQGEESAAAFGANSQVVPTPFGTQGEESAAAFGANSQVAPTPFGTQGEESAAAFGADSQVVPTPFGTQGEESAAAFGANSQVVPTPFGTQGEESAAAFGANSQVVPTPFGTKGVDAQHRGDAQSTAKNEADFRTLHDLGTRPLLLSVGRLSARKGLREFVTHALPQIVAAYPDVILLIVGDAPNQALHAEAQTPDSIREAAKRAGVADNLRFLGTITDYGELGAVYRAADVHVFPVREIPGDPEGFGMVAVEAAAHGLPTVAFATGGVVDAIAEGQSGRLVSPGNYIAFADAVLQTLAEGQGLQIGCVAFARQFEWPRFGVQIGAQLQLARAARGTVTQ